MKNYNMCLEILKDKVGKNDLEYAKVLNGIGSLRHTMGQN